MTDTATTVRAGDEGRVADAIRDFQARNGDWARVAFDGDPTDMRERVSRFVEEALELAQSLGQSADDARQLVEYVHGRPVGEPSQEMGGVMTTAALLANTAGLDMLDCGERELARVATAEILAKIREKRSKRHGRGALPGTHAPDFIPAATPADINVDAPRDPTSGISFVPMTASDADLATYVAEVRPGMDPGDTETPEDLAAMIAAVKLLAWFAVKDGEVVGWCAVAPWHGKYADRAWHLYGSWVRDDMRRRGLAKVMWRLRIDMVPRDLPVTVSTRPGTTGSERLADVFGFEPLGASGPWVNRILRTRT